MIYCIDVNSQEVVKVLYLDEEEEAHNIGIIGDQEDVTVFYESQTRTICANIYNDHFTQVGKARPARMQAQATKDVLLCISDTGDIDLYRRDAYSKNLPALSPQNYLR